MGFGLDEKLARLSRLAYSGDPRRHFLLAAGGHRPDGVWVEAANGGAVGGPCPPAHAESRAARKLGRADTLYVVRVLRDGTWGLAKPCHFCEKRLRDQGIKKVVYTVTKRRAAVMWL